MNPGLCFGLMILIVIYSIFFIVLPRVRDIEIRWWWCLFCLIPLVNIVLGIVLLFHPPKNRFGISKKLKSSN